MNPTRYGRLELALMENALFWLLWGVISFWALKTFYYSFSKEKIDSLRKTAFGISLAVLVLFFLPWMPVSKGGFTGIHLVLNGHAGIGLYFVLLILSSLFFIAHNSRLLKIAAVFNIINSVLIVLNMIAILPGTYVFTLRNSAPLISVLLLLINNVVLLLLWQQLQLLEKRRNPNF